MDLINFAGLNIPFFIFSILFLSYVIWCKFFNNSKLSINNDINNISDILSIFAFILVMFTSLIFFGSMIIEFLNLNLTNNMPFILKLTNYTIAILGVFGVLFFISLYRHRLVDKNSLKEIFKKMIEFYFFILILLFGFWIVIMFTILRPIFYDMIGFLIVMFSCLIFCYIIVNNSLFKINWKNITKKRMTWIILITILIFMFISIFFIPHVKYKAQEDIKYYIYNVDSDMREIYKEVRVPIKIKTWGIIRSFTPVIILDYDKYNLDLGKIGNENFKIILRNNSTNKENILIEKFDSIKNFNEKDQGSYSFEKILNDNKKLLILKYDKKNIKKENIDDIILEGYVRENVSKLKFDYEDNTQQQICNNGHCAIEIKINNKLEGPVFIEEDTLINLGSRDIGNSSKCSFKSIGSNFRDNKEKKEDILCGGNSNSCQLGLSDLKGKKIIDFKLVPDNFVIRIHDTKIYEPIDIHITALIECQ